MVERKRGVAPGDEASQAEPYTEMPVFTGGGAHDSTAGGHESGTWPSSLADPGLPGGIPEEEVTESAAGVFDASALHTNDWVHAAWKVFRASAREFAAVQALAVVLTIASAGLLAGPLHLGMAHYARKRIEGIDAELKELFAGFSRESFLASFLAGLGFLAALYLVLAIDTVFVSALGRASGKGWALVAVFHGLAFLVASFLAGAWLILLYLLGERSQSLVDAWETLMGMLRADWAAVSWLFVATGLAPVAGALVFVGILVGGPVGILIAAHSVRALYPVER